MIEFQSAVPGILSECVTMMLTTDTFLYAIFLLMHYYELLTNLLLLIVLIYFSQRVQVQLIIVFTFHT